jgi:hypothetical protein
MTGTNHDEQPPKYWAPFGLLVVILVCVIVYAIKGMKL